MSTWNRGMVKRRRLCEAFDQDKEGGSGGEAARNYYICLFKKEEWINGCAAVRWCATYISSSWMSTCNRGMVKGRGVCEAFDQEKEGGRRGRSRAILYILFQKGRMN